MTRTSLEDNNTVSIGSLPIAIVPVTIALRDIWRNVFSRSRLCYSVASVCRRRLSVRNVLWLRPREQKLLLTAYRKSYLRNRLVPKWMTLLDLCLEVVSSSCRLRYIRRWISWKPLSCGRWRDPQKCCEEVRSPILATTWLLVMCSDTGAHFMHYNRPCQSTDSWDRWAYTVITRIWDWRFLKNVKIP